ncbi:hypothetical protein M514_08147 [Trichuris suis]|uniref:Uncharacterized protein n=1 Tax=Trichuris suis TaxID=68888 RepID=A0A085M169_9BILA|nr:hypothetical protein M513_08147 [Trichuris suis]KFD71890.1 hypothetical protein M514_08147 [Trichuris suis]
MNYVPDQFSGKQKLAKLDNCKKLIDRHQEEPYLEQIFTCDEKGAHMIRRSEWPCGWTNSSPESLPKLDVHAEELRSPFDAVSWE